LLAVVVLVVNVLFRRWLTPGQLCLMWALVLARLLIPAAPPSAFSLENLFVSNGSEANNAQLVETPHVYAGSAEIVQSAPPTPADSKATDRLEDWIERSLQVLPIVCFVGGFGSLTWTLANHWRFARHVNSAPRCTDARITRLWLDCCADAKVRHPGEIVI